MPRVRPTEHRAIAELLVNPADSVDDLATDILLKVDELREKRTDWVLVVRHSAAFYAVYGPFVTRNAAEKEIGRSVVAANEGVTWLALPLYGAGIDEGVVPVGMAG